MGLAEQIVWIGNLFLVLVLIVKLVSGRLHRIYFWFFLMLCFQALQSLGMLPLKQESDLYAWAYFLTQSALWVLYMLAVLELYSLALRKHQGITSMSRWFMLGALLVSVFVSALTLPADLSRPAEKFPILVYFSVFERAVTFSLVLLLLLITGFLLWTPISIRRNIVRACEPLFGFFPAIGRHAFPPKHRRVEMLRYGQHCLPFAEFGVPAVVDFAAQ